MKIGRIRNLSAQALAGVWLAGVGMADAIAVPIISDYLYAEQIHRDYYYYYKYEYSLNNTAGQYNISQDWGLIQFSGRILAPTNLSGASIEINTVSGGANKMRSVILPSDNACPASSTVRCYNYNDYSGVFNLHVREYFIDGITLFDFGHYYQIDEYYNASGSYSVYDEQYDVTGDPSSLLSFGDDLMLSITINALGGDNYQGSVIADMLDVSTIDGMPWTCYGTSTYCEEWTDERNGKQFSGVPTNIDNSPIPEPTVLSLLSLGLLGLGWSRTRRAR